MAASGQNQLYTTFLRRLFEGATPGKAAAQFGRLGRSGLAAVDRGCERLLFGSGGVGLRSIIWVVLTGEAVFTGDTRIHYGT